MLRPIDPMTKDLFFEALDVPCAERRAFLETRCGEANVREDVLDLLQKHESAQREGKFAPLHSGSFSRELLESAGTLTEDGDPPVRFGNYRVVRELGRGGMGIVYLAEDENLGNCEVALKVLSPDLIRDDDSWRRFQREIEALGQMDHPNIVRARSVIADDNGRKVLVMDYVKGRTLEHLVREDGPLSVRDACRLVAQVAEGMQYAHIRNVIHRDLRPANLMVTENGHVKILDFGIARTSVNESRPLTRPGFVVGSIEALAPELIYEGAREPTVKSDLFSLGCTLYFAITGNHAQTSGEQARGKTTERDGWGWPPCLPGKLPGLSMKSRKMLNLVLARLLHRSPTQRYDSASQATDALRGVLAGMESNLRLKSTLLGAVLLLIALILMGPFFYAALGSSEMRLTLVQWQLTWATLGSVLMVIWYLVLLKRGLTCRIFTGLATLAVVVTAISVWTSRDLYPALPRFPQSQSQLGSAITQIAGAMQRYIEHSSTGDGTVGTDASGSPASGLGVRFIVVLPRIRGRSNAAPIAVDPQVREYTCVADLLSKDDAYRVVAVHWNQTLWRKLCEGSPNLIDCRALKSEEMNAYAKLQDKLHEPETYVTAPFLHADWVLFRLGVLRDADCDLVGDVLFTAEGSPLSDQDFTGFTEDYKTDVDLERASAELYFVSPDAFATRLRAERVGNRVPIVTRLLERQSVSRKTWNGADRLSVWQQIGREFRWGTPTFWNVESGKTDEGSP